MKDLLQADTQLLAWNMLFNDADHGRRVLCTWHKVHMRRSLFTGPSLVVSQRNDMLTCRHEAARVATQVKQVAGGSLRLQSMQRSGCVMPCVGAEGLDRHIAHWTSSLVPACVRGLPHEWNATIFMTILRCMMPERPCSSNSMAAPALSPGSPDCSRTCRYACAAVSCLEGDSLRQESCDRRYTLTRSSRCPEGTEAAAHPGRRAEMTG